MGRKLVHFYTDEQEQQGTQNFVDLFNWFKANVTEVVFMDAALWYTTALNDISSILVTNNAHKDITLRKACAIVSALSVGNNWYSTLEDFENLIQWDSEGRPTELPKSRTYKQQTRKAVRLLDHTMPLTTPVDSKYEYILGGLKTQAFYHALMGDTYGRYVVDRHMIRAFHNEWISKPVVNKQQYMSIDRSLAHARQIVNDQENLWYFTPAQFQAVLWVAQLLKTQYRDFSPEV